MGQRLVGVHTSDIPLHLDCRDRPIGSGFGSSFGSFLSCGPGHTIPSGPGSSRGFSQPSACLILLVHLLAVIPVKDIFREQAGCQVCGQDLDCSTEQGAERLPGLMSDWDATIWGCLPQGQELVSGICDITTGRGRELSLSDPKNRAPGSWLWLSPRNERVVFVVNVFETESLNVAQASLKFSALLPQPLECWVI